MSSKPVAAKKPDRPRVEHLESLERGLRVLALFGADGQHAFTMTEVAERLEITRASALRLLGTLETLGFVHSSDRAYHLGVRVLWFDRDEMAAFEAAYFAWLKALAGRR